MIERIEIARCASYGDKVEEMGPLSSINFVYGSNGAGKTTISRLINDASSYSYCRVHWERGTKLESMVYNRDFVNTNFSQGADLKGIFTLGQKDIETENKIALAKADVDALTQRIEQLTYTLQGNDGTGGKCAELTTIDSQFRDECWKVKAKHDAKLQGALIGYRSDKQKFKDKLLLECSRVSSQPPSLLELEKKAATVFGNAPTSEAFISDLSADAFLKWERDQVLRKRVIGKADVDIAAMIQKIGNSDWIKQGIAFYEINDGYCPFCQQKAPESLAASLAEYFDETFAEDAAAIDALRVGYKLEGERLQRAIQSAIASGSRFLDIDRLKAEKSIFDSRYQANQQRIESKAKEPSQTVTLDPLGDVLASAQRLISDANDKIKEHNSTVANLATERARLTSQVWSYFAKVEISSAFLVYQSEKTRVGKAITSLSTQISTLEVERAKKEAEIRGLESSTTSIQPTVSEINKLLKSFGFRNFSIEATKTNHYKIRRPDGSDAQNTLSEGERGFITFLYFYYLLKGSNTDSGMTRSRVAVFDDPVCSLDSDVMFVVSSLIRQVVEDVRAARGNIKQVFVLTHNVYFHKEITFDQNRTNARKDETFWTIRKVNGVSTVQKHVTNPITTTYDLLWSEVRNPNHASQTIQNTLRRILECYFRILGGIGNDQILDHFEGEEKHICRSLLSWVNDGSHSVPDDVFLTPDSTMVEKYLEVFRKIFFRLNHGNHYNMMMGSPYFIESVVAVPVAGGA